MMHERQIVFEDGAIAVYRLARRYFEVVRMGATHATVDSAYESLDLALARAGYLTRGTVPRGLR